jgi:hypothetical protein
VYKRKGFKATKNIVVGIIFTLLLLAYGSFTFVFADMYSHDFSYVSQVAEKINFTLPSIGLYHNRNTVKGPIQYG